MKHSKLTRWVRKSLPVIRLAPWILAAGVLGLVLAQADLEAMPGLFQSALPTATLAPTTIPSPTIVMTETLTPASTLPPPTLPVMDTVTPPTVASPTAAPVLATATDLSPAATATEPPAPADEERYPPEAANLRFDWRMLFDSAALGISYLWLACGVVLFLLFIAVFVYLWGSSTRRRQRE